MRKMDGIRHGIWMTELMAKTKQPQIPDNFAWKAFKRSKSFHKQVGLSLHLRNC